MQRYLLSALALSLFSLTLTSCDAVSDPVDMAAVSTDSGHEKAVISQTVTSSYAEFSYDGSYTFDLEFDLTFDEGIQTRPVAFRWMKRTLSGGLTNLVVGREYKTADGFDLYLDWTNAVSDSVTISYYSGGYMLNEQLVDQRREYLDPQTPTIGALIGRTQFSVPTGLGDNDPRIKSKHVNHKGSITFDYYPGPDDMHPDFVVPPHGTNLTETTLQNVSHVTIVFGDAVKPDASRIEWPKGGTFTITSLN